MQTQTKLVLVIMAICVLCVSLGVALGVVHFTRAYIDESERIEAELEAERMAELEKNSVLTPELKEQLDFVIAMEEAIEKKDGLVATRDMSPEEFEALSDLEVVEIIAYETLPTEYVDWDAEMKKPIDERGVTETLTAPKGHYRAGDFEKMPASLERDVPLDGLWSGARQALSRLLVGETLPGCAAAGEEAYYVCTMSEINALATLRLQRPLYASLAKLDPKSVSLIAERLLAIPPDAPMFDGERTLAQVYRQLDGRVATYIRVREVIRTHGDERALRAYREERATGLDDMIIFYERFATKLGLDFNDMYELGFWLRRMDDGSAPVIFDTLEKAQTRYAE